MVKETNNTTTEVKDVELHLASDQADMIQDLLSNYVYAYRSDSEVDCERVPVKIDKVGTYPYPLTLPSPDLINPCYDWVNNTWYDKSKEGLSQFYKRVDKLDKSSALKDKQFNAIQESINQSNETSTILINQVNQMGTQFSQALQDLGTAVNNLSKDPTPTEPKVESTKEDNE